MIRICVKSDRGVFSAYVRGAEKQPLGVESYFNFRDMLEEYIGRMEKKVHLIFREDLPYTARIELAKIVDRHNQMLEGRE